MYGSNSRRAQIPSVTTFRRALLETACQAYTAQLHTQGLNTHSHLRFAAVTQQSAGTDKAPEEDEEALAEVPALTLWPKGNHI